MCQKLQAMGLGGRMTAFVYNWMNGRLLWISDRIAVRSRIGIPQGSPLSCSLANIYISDLADTLRSRGLTVVNYADDTNIVSRSSRRTDKLSAQAEELSDKLREALSITEDWARASGAKLKEEKSKVSCFLPRNNRYEGKVTAKINLPGIDTVSEPTILGVLLDRFGIGGKHVRARVEKSWKRVGGLRTLCHVGLRLMRKLYIGGVRPMMLYGVESFDSITPTAIASMERLQSGALRHMARLRDCVPSIVVGRLMRAPPIELVVECRWRIRDGMERVQAREWLEEEWERRTPIEHRVLISKRDDPLWELPRILQTAILRARSGYTLLQPAEEPRQPCTHPRCMDYGYRLSAKHILEECHKYESKRRGLRTAVPGPSSYTNLLWPTNNGRVETLRRTARFLIEIGA
jgi:hypothetical protein